MRFVKTAENLFGLPQGFTRVEYLESSGTQYIDTGVQNGSELSFYINFNINNTTYSGTTITHFYGSRNQDIVGGGNGTRLYNLSLEDDYFGTRVTLDSNFQFDIYHTIEKNKNITIYDGTTYTHTSVSEITTQQTVKVFGFTLAGGSSNSFNRKMRIKQFRISNNNTLVRDYIPAVDPLGVACMYDLVGKKPYYNQGTGTFTAGRQIIPVEYLEGTGTQYIDTGVRGFADFEIGIQLRNNASNVSIFCGNNYRLERYNASNPYWRFRNDNDFYNSGIPITEHHVMEWKNDEVYADGVKLQDFAKTWNVSANMTLFGASTAIYPSMIYFCKLWNPTDGTLLRDYIPCKDENDNGFLFDKVSGVCYLNNGTGNFAFGENKYKTKLRLIKDNKLPAGYTQVEYLESSGIQRITTDVSVASGDSFNLIVKGAFTTLTGYSQFMGVNGGAYFGLTTTGYYSVGQATGTATGVLADTDNHTFDLSCTIGNNQTNILKIDGTSYSNVRNNSAGDIKLFDVLNSYACYFKMAGATVYKNNTLVRDFIPALDPTGTPCIYDLVTKTPFYNQGTGTFSYGKTISMVRFVQDIIPREYAAVNYIESTGTQYIDTKIPNKEELTYQVTAAITRYASDYPLCGVVGATQYSCQRVLMYNNAIGIQRGIYGSLALSISYDDNFHTYYSSPTKLKIDDRELSYSRAFSGDLGSNTFLLLAYTNVNGTIKNSQPAKLCCAKLWDNGILVRNFIPVIRRIDKVAGMWDTVTKQFFGNSGTGTFNYG